jgi:hypothetical protein
MVCISGKISHKTKGDRIARCFIFEPKIPILAFLESFRMEHFGAYFRDV